MLWRNPVAHTTSGQVRSLGRPRGLTAQGFPNPASRTGKQPISLDFFLNRRHDRRVTFLSLSVVQLPAVPPALGPAGAGVTQQGQLLRQELLLLRERYIPRPATSCPVPINPTRQHIFGGKRVLLEPGRCLLEEQRVGLQEAGPSWFRRCCR